MKVELGLENIRIDSPSEEPLKSGNLIVTESRANYRGLARMKKREAELQPNIRQLLNDPKKEFQEKEAIEWIQGHLRDPLTGQFVQRNNYFNHEEFYYMGVSQKSLDDLRTYLQEYLGNDVVLSPLHSSAFAFDRRANVNEPHVKKEAYKDYSLILTGLAEDLHPRRLDGNEIVLRKEWIATFSVPDLQGFYGWSGNFSVRIAFQEKRVPLNSDFENVL